MNSIRAFYQCFTISLVMTATVGRGQLAAVPTARVPVTNIYQGVTVVDGYQWLEEGTNPAVRDWTRRQNERTHAWLGGLKFREGLTQELSELIADESASYSLVEDRGGVIFATRFKPPAQQPVVVRLNSVFPPALRQVGVRSECVESQGHHGYGLADDFERWTASGNLPFGEWERAGGIAFL